MALSSSPEGTGTRARPRFRVRRPAENGSPRTNTRRFQERVRQVHRITGGVAAVFLLLLAVSGFLLNHPGLLGAPPDRTLALGVDPLDSRHLFRGTPSGLYDSRDGGETWEEVPMLLPAERAVDIAFVPGKPERVYVALESLGLIRSTDGGIVWEQVPLGFVPLAEGIRLQRIGIGRDERLSLWTSGGLMISEDAGETWAPVGRQRRPGRDLHTLVHQVHTGYFFSAWFFYLYDAAAGWMVLLILTGFLIWQRRGRKAQRVQKS